MKRTIRTVMLVFLLLPVIVIFGLSNPDENSGEYIFPVSEYYESWQRIDRNNDGKIDHAVQFGKEDKKLREALDYNYDGFMDDFYVYEDGILIKEMLDTNFDHKVDLWVYISEGMYIVKYERDTDFDGEIDEKKDYREE